MYSCYRPVTALQLYARHCGALPITNYYPLTTMVQVSMDRLKKMLRQKEFHIFVVCLFSILFSWPFIAIPEKKGPTGIFIYLLLVWGIMIVLLFFMSRSFGKKTKGEDGTRRGGSTDV